MAFISSTLIVIAFIGFVVFIETKGLSFAKTFVSSTLIAAILVSFFIFITHNPTGMAAIILIYFGAMAKANQKRRLAKGLKATNTLLD